MPPCFPGQGSQRQEDAWDFLASLATLIGEFQGNERLCLKNKVDSVQGMASRRLSSRAHTGSNTPLSLYTSPLQCELKRWDKTRCKTRKRAAESHKALRQSALMLS